VPHQDYRLGVARGQLVDQFLYLMRPACLHRIGRIVGMHVKRLDVVVFAQQPEQLAVDACRVAVGMREVQLGFGHFLISPYGHCKERGAKKIERPL
jgi:hypothetical protein